MPLLVSGFETQLEEGREGRGEEKCREWRWKPGLVCSWFQRG